MFSLYKRSVSGILVCAMLIALLSPVGSLTGLITAVEEQTLTSLTVDGGYTLSFAESQKTYEIHIPAGHPRVPQISAQSDPSNTVTVTQAMLPESSTSGVATAIVTDGQGNSVEYKVTFVKDPAKGFHLQYNDYYTFKPENADTVTQFVSSNPAVASVTAEGVVQALALSDTAVTIEAKNAAGTTVDTLVIDKIVKAPLNIFLITGQSNAYGSYDIPTGTNEAAFTAQQLEHTLKPDPGTVLCTDVSNTGSILRDMYDLSAGRSGFSPALGKTWYALTGEKTLMLQTAVGGSPIEAWMKPEGETRYTYNNAASNFYETTKKALEHALEKINASDSCYELNRIHAYWLQGETGMGNTYNPSKNGAGIGGWDLGSTAHILSSEEYYNMFMKNMEYFEKEFNVEFMGILLARATQGVSSAESLSLQLLTDLVPTRAAQYALHNTNGMKITMVSRVCDIARMESYADQTVEGYGYMGCNNLHYNQIGHNANGVAAATNSYYALSAAENKKATDIEVIKANGRDRFAENEELLISAGGTYQTAAMVLPMYTDTPGVTYEVADTSVCTIDKYGLITAKEDALGKETTVTFKCEAAGLSKTIKVKVASVSVSGSLNSNISWTLENGVLTVTGTGDTPSYTATSSPFAPYANDIKTVVIGEGITRIGNYLFYQMAGIETVQLPDSLKAVNARAFAGCTGITEIAFGADFDILGMEAFKESGVTDVWVETSGPLGTVSSTAPFAGCTYTVHAPCNGTWVQSDVTKWGGTATLVAEHRYEDDACVYCQQADPSVKKGTCGENINWRLKDGVLTLTGTGETTSYTASGRTPTTPWVDDSEQITKIVVGEGITRLGNYIFYNLTKVTEVQLPDTLAAINARAFGYCESLTTVTLPASVKILGQYAFINSGVKSVYFESATAPTTVSTSPFGGCSYTVYAPCGGNWADSTIANWGGSSKTLVLQHNYQGAACADCGEATPEDIQLVEALKSQIAALGTGVTNDDLTELFMQASSDGTIHLETNGEPYILTESGLKVTIDRITEGYVSRVTAGAFQQMLEIAQSYVDKRGDLVYGNFNTPWNETTTNEIDCSSFTQLVLSGVAFKDSRFVSTNTENKATYDFGITFPANPYRTEFGSARYLANDLGRYALDQGYAFYPNEDYTNMQPGDVLFFSTNTNNESYFMNITHVGICVERKDGNIVYIVHGNINDVVNYYDLNLVDGNTGYDNSLVLIARFPVKEAKIGGTCGADITWKLEDGVLTLTGTGEATDYTVSNNVPNNPFVAYADQITEIVVGEGITGVEDNLFHGLTAVTKVTLPSTLTRISTRAFKNCTALKELTVPAGVTFIGLEALMGSGITDLYFEGDAPTSFGGRPAFNSTEHAYNLHILCNNETFTETVLSKLGGVATVVKEHDYQDHVCTRCQESDVVIPTGTCGADITWKLEDGVLTLTGTGATVDYNRNATTDIVDYPWAAFKDEITEIVVGEGITTLENHLFYRLTNVTKVTLPSTLTRIETRVFKGCTALKELTINSDLVFLGYEALTGSGITDLYFEGNAPASFGGSPAFNSAEHVYNLHILCNNETFTETVQGKLGGVATVVEEHDYQNHICSRCGEDDGTLVTGVTLNKTELGLTVGGSETLTATVMPETAGNKAVIWTSSDNTIATVADGLVTALKAGTVTITATSAENGEIKATCTVTVAVPMSGTCGENVTWTYANGTLTLTGTGKTVDYKRNSADDTVDYPWAAFKDEITKIVVGEGITTLENLLFYRLTNVTSVKLPTTLERMETRVFKGCTSLKEVTIPGTLVYLGLEAFVESGITDLYFKGDAPAGFSTTKACTGLTYNIWILCNNETFTETVLDKLGGTPTIVLMHDWEEGEHYEECSRCDAVNGVPVTGITLNKNELALEVGGSETLTAVIAPENATVQSVVWTSSDASVATVVNGVVTALKGGTVTITAASAENGEIKVTCAVTVTVPSVLTGTCGSSISWRLENGVLTLTGTGDTTEFTRTAATDTVNTPWWSVRDTITEIVVGEGIVNLDNYVFYGCTNVTKVTLPTTLERIETRVFKDFTKLTTLTINSNLKWLGLEAIMGSGITDLYFTGDAPAGCSGTKPATGLTYNIHVPCNNETWTDAKLTAIGGTPTLIREHNWSNGTCGACGANQNVPVSSVTLDKATASITIAERLTLTATVLPENAADKSLTWTSSDDTVATVSGGVVTPLKGGSVTITVTANDGSGKSASCTITISDDVVGGTCGESVNWKLEEGVLTLTGTGSTTEFTRNASADTVNTPWWNFRESITKVVVGEGITTVDNYAFYNLSNLTSVQLPVSLERIETRVFTGCTKLTSLTVGASGIYLGYEAFAGSGITDLYFTGEAYDNCSSTPPCKNLTFTLHTSCAATGWSAAKIGALGGTATQVVEHSWSGNQCTGCGAKANNPVTGIQMDATATVYVSSTYAIQAVITPSDASDKALEWTSSNEAIVTVSSVGVITGVAPGTAVITATAKDGSGVKATCTVTVKEGHGGNCGIDAYWSFENGVLTITGTGDLTIFTRNAQTDAVNYPWADIKDQITKVVIGEGITGVKNYAFYKCSNIASVTLPSTLTVISYGAFQGTTALKSITIPAAVSEMGSQVFKDSGLTEVIFLGKVPGDRGSNLFAGVTATVKYICTDTPAELDSGLTWEVYHNMVTADGVTRCTNCGLVEGTQITGITLDKTEISLTVGESITLSAVITPADATYTVLEWSSSETAVVTVTADGVVTAVDPGSATIIVKAADGSGIQAVCKVTVRDKNAGGNNDPTTGDISDPTQQPGKTPDDTQKADQSKDNTWIIWALCGGIAVVGVLLVVLLTKKKKATV